LRNQLNHAESEEDVKKFFVETVERLLSMATGRGVTPKYNDIMLVPEKSPWYRIAPDLLNSEALKALRSSDFDAVMKRLAEPAAHRYQHVAKHPEKTRSKIKGH
jgi:hypothetical protein